MDESDSLLQRINTEHTDNLSLPSNSVSNIVTSPKNVWSDHVDLDFEKSESYTRNLLLSTARLVEYEAHIDILDLTTYTHHIPNYIILVLKEISAKSPVTQDLLNTLSNIFKNTSEEIFPCENFISQLGKDVISIISNLQKANAQLNETVKRQTQQLTQLTIQFTDAESDQQNQKEFICEQLEEQVNCLIVTKEILEKELEFERSKVNEYKCEIENLNATVTKMASQLNPYNTTQFRPKKLLKIGNEDTLEVDRPSSPSSLTSDTESIECKSIINSINQHETIIERLLEKEASYKCEVEALNQELKELQYNYEKQQRVNQRLISQYEREIADLKMVAKEEKETRVQIETECKNLLNLQVKEIKDSNENNVFSPVLTDIVNMLRETEFNLQAHLLEKSKVILHLTKKLAAYQINNTQEEENSFIKSTNIPPYIHDIQKVLEVTLLENARLEQELSNSAHLN